jgi:hypothetical protein
MAMTCEAAADLLDAFVDAELEPSASVEVARHAGQCARCDGMVRDLLTVREGLIARADAVVDGMDLAGLWARVDAEIVRSDTQRAWRDRAAGRRRGLSRTVAWGAVAAMAAGALLAVRLGGTAPDQIAQIPQNVRPKRPPNHVLIDRLAGKDIALRREPKSGTTMIWVNHEVESSGW